MLHFHKWIIIKSCKVIDVSFGWNAPKISYHLQCEKCGKYQR